MSGPSGTLEQVKPLKREGSILPEAKKIGYPALQVGAVSGTTGLLIGAFAGILRSQTPVLFSLVSGVQCFILGFNITAFRSLIVQSWSKERLTQNDKILVSSLAGGLGGGMSGALLRGRRNVVPGAIMFSLFGALGQIMFNKFETRALEQASGIPKNKASWLDSRWSPIKPISDKEYEHLMKEKLLQLKAEIALVDDKIQSLRIQQKERQHTETEKTPVPKH